MNEAEEIAAARAQAIIVESLLCLAIFGALIYSVIRIWQS
jgi:hypothetical protein